MYFNSVCVRFRTKATVRFLEPGTVCLFMFDFKLTLITVLRHFTVARFSMTLKFSL